MPIRITVTARLAAPKYRSHRKAGRKAMPKKPPAIPTAATGALIRASHLSPPYMIVGTVSEMTPAINLACRDSCISQPLMFGAPHPGSLHAKLYQADKEHESPKLSTLRTVWSRTHAARKLLWCGDLRSSAGSKSFLLV